MTLVELLIALAVLGVLLGVLLPVLSGSIAAARSFRCQMTLRNTAFDLHMFLDPRLDASRERDPCERDGSVALETFQESLYGIDEFWAYGEGASRVELRDSQDVPLRCAEVHGGLVLRSDAPCSAGGVASWKTVSYTFNSRLHRATDREGRALQLCVREALLEEPNVPLAWDVDGVEATRLGVTPVFNAPPLGVDDLYEDGRSWTPAARHGGGLNVVFIDGRVESTRTPLAEPSWQWAYNSPW